MKGLSFICLLFSLLISCKEPEKDQDPVKVEDRAVFILNEGNMGYGNASIDIYQPGNGSVDQKIFFKNNGRPLGDVLESMKIIGNKAYLVVNNSSKIEIVELPSFKVVGSIQNLASPRLILPVSSNKAYVSDFTANEIHILDLHTNTKVAAIATGGWIEGMALSGKKLFACHAIDDQIWVIDSGVDTLLNKIEVGVEPLSIVSDKDGTIWALCTGGFEEAFPALYKIDPITESVLDVFSFPIKSEYPDNLQIDAAGEKLYYLNNGLYKMNITDTQLPAKALIPSNGRLLYGLGLDPNSGDIYLSDAIDYQQRGSIYHYDSEGRELGSFKAGIIPGAFGFYK